MSVVPERHAERGEDLPPVAGEEGPEPAEPARASPVPSCALPSRRGAPLAVRRARRRCAASASATAPAVVDAGEHVAEAHPHRALRRRRARRHPRSVSCSRSARRSSSSVARVDQPALDEGVDGGGDGGLGEREAAGDLARPVGAVADHGQEPVLGQGDGGSRSVQARSSRRARRARVSTSRFRRLRTADLHTGSVPNSS